jgi:hypothetical protein
MARPVTGRFAATPRTQPAADHAVDRAVCPRCGRRAARVIGRSEVMPVVYLQCDGCKLLSIAGG